MKDKNVRRIVLVTNQFSSDLQRIIFFKLANRKKDYYLCLKLL
jgi:hypothetical protein